MIKAWSGLTKCLKTRQFTKQMNLFTTGIHQEIRARWIDPLQIMDEPEYPPKASISHEFKSRVSLCQTMLIQMEWMDEDDMQMFGVSDLYDYVKGMANFRVW